LIFRRLALNELNYRIIIPQQKVDPPLEAEDTGLQVVTVNRETKQWHYVAAKEL
jgi:hypothetical protein